MPGSTRTLHILYINAQTFYYGAEHSLLELIRALDGVRVTVLTQGPGRFTEALASYDITFDYFDFQRHHPPTTRRFADRLNAILQQSGADLVHLNKPHLSHENFLLALRTVTRERNIPLIVHIRSNEVPYNSSQLDLLRSMDHWIFVSHGIKRNFLNDYRDMLAQNPLPPSSVIYDGRPVSEYVSDGTSRDRFRTEHGLNDRDSALGLIGYLHPLKGQKEFVRLASMLKTEDRTKFFIVGGRRSDFGSYYDEVEQLIVQHGLQARVSLLGYRDTKSVYPGLDLIVNMSTTEGLPGSIIEAMAAGRNVLAYSVGGIPELLGDQATDLLIEAGNIPAMRKAILKLQKDDCYRESVVQAARVRVSKLFDIKMTADNTHRLYSHLLNAKPPRQGSNP